MTDEKTCTGCGHAWKSHYWPEGCYVDWRWDARGIANVDEGCPCQLAHCEYSSDRIPPVGATS